jgi:ubiquinone/menaquinone biosynthesis C-methylase UbiE
MMNIGRFAPWYRWCEYVAFGRALERRRFAYLPRLAASRRILVLGEGDGRSLARLLASAPQAQIHVVEISPEMIALSRRRVEDSSRVRFLQEDALAASFPDNYYDAVVTLFFLDCFQDAEARTLIRRLAAAMAQRAVWLVSDFAIPPQGWRNWHAKVWLWTMYRFFSIATGLRTRSLPAIDKLLTEAGLRCLDFEEERAGLIRSEIYIKDV